ncbi:MAG: Rnf-Nqr domain containing protein [Oscillospiraceae bacterium]|jgi:Na+-translocating ferredoxin:NAD+ oxidoreductase RnfE subunit
MTRNFYRENRSFFDAIDGFLLKNTVLEKGLVVAPVVVVSNSLKNGVALSIAFGVITFLTVFATSFISKRIPHTLRVILGVLFAGVVYIPTAMLIDLVLPGASYQIGVFLPLMITNSLIVWRSESRFHRESKPRMIGDLICHILGFLAVISLVGAVREIWGSGTLWDVKVPFAVNPVGGILLPFAGFILLGFLAALLHRYNNYLTASDNAPEPDKEAGDFGYLTLPVTGPEQVEDDKTKELEEEVAAHE